MIGLLRLFIRAVLAILCVLFIIPIMFITWNLGARKATRAVMQTAFRFGAFAWSVRIRTVGTLSTARPLLLVSNHFSYLDLFALGSLVPAAFTPKSEIASWPLLGPMCRASGCLFIDRRPSQTMTNKKRLDDAARHGDIIHLFPEGTTSDGTGLLPFKSSFFSIAEKMRLDVQPVSILYTALSGRPMDSTTLPLVGWYGDAEFFPHVVRFLQEKNVDVTVVFHASINSKDFTSRKELANACRSVIEHTVFAQSSLRSG